MRLPPRPEGRGSRAHLIMADYLTLVQQLQREVGIQGAPTSTVVGQSDIKNKLVHWIADADIHIQSMHWDWRFLWSQYSQVTASGNSTPPIPGDLNVWDRDSFYLDHSSITHKKLITMEYQRWTETLRQGVKTNNKPQIVVIKPDNSLILNPPPDAVYNLTADYWKTPVKLINNTDISPIPAAFHRIILIQAKLWYAEEQEIPIVYQSANNELHGNRANQELGLLSRLESLQLPGQEGRAMGAAPSFTITVE